MHQDHTTTTHTTDVPMFRCRAAAHSYSRAGRQLHHPIGRLPRRQDEPLPGGRRPRRRLARARGNEEKVRFLWLARLSCRSSASTNCRASPGSPVGSDAALLALGYQCLHRSPFKQRNAAQPRQGDCKQRGTFWKQHNTCFVIRGKTPLDSSPDTSPGQSAQIRRGAGY